MSASGYDVVAVDGTTLAENGGSGAREENRNTELDTETAAHRREYRRLMRKFWFAAAFAVPVMAVGYPELPWLYLPNLFTESVSEGTVWSLFALSGLLTVPVLFYSGRQFFTGAWTAFRHRSTDMNTLIALATSAAWMGEHWTVLRQTQLKDPVLSFMATHVKARGSTSAAGGDGATTPSPLEREESL